MKEMKTFDEILIETHASISIGEMMGVESKLSFRDIERLAAKEYAKQWVHEFALQTFHHLDEYHYYLMLQEVEPRIKKEIDEQDKQLIDRSSD